MKKIASLLVMILLASMIASSAVAEVLVEEGWQADIQKLMDESLIPKSTATIFDYSVPEDAEVFDHSLLIERINGEGLAMRIEIEMISTEDFSGEDWASIDAWMEKAVDNAVQGVAAESEAMNDAVTKAVETARKQVVVPEGREMPVWSKDALMVTEVTVTIPYYPELEKNDNGTATQELQEQLVQLGFLNDTADGYYGARTEAAVALLESYVRELEQDVIDALPTVEPTATPEPTAAPEEEQSEEGEDEEPAEEAEEAPMPTPATPEDGVADAVLQAYLFSDDFKVTRGDLASGDSGIDVVRLQNRLANLGYLAQSADGHYGGDTARAVRIFCYYNGLDLTGDADAALQELLFSENAKEPANPMLAQGSSGDEVRELQKRLRVLGFMNSSADGDFGAGTARGVETLQKYMRDMEEAKLREDEAVMATLDASGDDISTLLTVEVNGIADPILLDDFYADEFPAIPAAMKNGSNGNDVIRLQRRLSGLEYYFSSLDGDYGSGTESAVRAFQKRNGLEQSGVAGEDTLKLLFSEDAKKALKPYMLKISTDKQRVYAYGLDANNEYTVLVRTMKCSTGKDVTPTPKGTFQNGTGPGARWHYFKKFKCWAQYAYYVQGDIMIHSVLYNEKDGPVTQSSVNNLGRKASHGCIRLSVEDAKWIYNNCPRNTKIVVY